MKMKYLALLGAALWLGGCGYVQRHNAPKVDSPKLITMRLWIPHFATERGGRISVTNRSTH